MYPLTLKPIYPIFYIPKFVIICNLFNTIYLQMSFYYIDVFSNIIIYTHTIEFLSNNYI